MSRHKGPSVSNCKTQKHSISTMKILKAHPELGKASVLITIPDREILYHSPPFSGHGPIKKVTW